MTKRSKGDAAGNPATDLQQAAAEGQPGMMSDFIGFITENKKWWLIPILLVMALFGVLVILSGTGVAPFIYTLF